MRPDEALGQVLQDLRGLNATVRANQGEISVVQARRMVKICREAEGWLRGLRGLLDTAAGDDEAE